jgi:uncharacterized protein YciI
MTHQTPDELTANMLRQSLYVIRTSPARGPGTAEMLAEHLEYQIALERSGTMFGAGPIYDEGEDTPSGGMIIVRATNFNEARKIADADPMHAHNLRRYTIEKWLLNEGSMTFTVRYSDRTAEIHP